MRTTLAKREFLLLLLAVERILLLVPLHLEGLDLRKLTRSN